MLRSCLDKVVDEVQHDVYYGSVYNTTTRKMLGGTWCGNVRRIMTLALFFTAGEERGDVFRAKQRTYT